MFDSDSIYLDDKVGDPLLEEALALSGPNANVGYEHFIGPTRWLVSANGTTWSIASDSPFNGAYNDTNAAFTALYAPSL